MQSLLAFQPQNLGFNVAWVLFKEPHLNLSLGNSYIKAINLLGMGNKFSTIDTSGVQ